MQKTNMVCGMGKSRHSGGQFWWAMDELREPKVKLLGGRSMRRSGQETANPASVVGESGLEEADVRS